MKHTIFRFVRILSHWIAFAVLFQLYCAQLAIFMQYTGVFPTIQLEIPTFHSIYAQVQLGILALKSTNQPELGPNMSIA